MAERNVVTRSESVADVLSALDAAHIPVDVAALLHDAHAERWIILLATSLLDREGRASSYRKIRRALQEAMVPSVELSDIVLASPSDSAIQELRQLSQQQQHPYVSPILSGRSIAGTDVAEGWLYPVEPLVYERRVFAALQRLAPTSVVLRFAYPLIGEGGKRLIADVWIEGGRAPVAVEIKATKRPLTRRVTDSLVQRFPTSVRLLVVSYSGFTNDMDLGQLDQRLFLVQWRSPADDDRLRMVLTSALDGDDAASKTAQ